MASLTLKQLDDQLLVLLRERAKSRGVSLNAFVREALSRLVGLDPGVTVYDDLSDLEGCWTDEEAAEFEANTHEFREIDEELWR